MIEKWARNGSVWWSGGFGVSGFVVGSSGGRRVSQRKAFFVESVENFILNFRVLNPGPAFSSEEILNMGLGKGFRACRWSGGSAEQGFWVGNWGNVGFWGRLRPPRAPKILKFPMLAHTGSR